MKLHIVTDIKEYYITFTNTMSKVKSKEFIDSTDGSSSDSDSDAELKAKKKKEQMKKKAEKRKSEENTEKPAKKTKTEEDSSSKKSEKSPKKKEKSGASSSIEGNAHDGFSLGKMRRISILEFKGRKLYDIREMYEKDGELKPGNKGISLSRGRWDTVMSHSDALSAAL